MVRSRHTKYVKPPNLSKTSGKGQQAKSIFDPKPAKRQTPKNHGTNKRGGGQQG